MIMVNEGDPSPATGSLCKGRISQRTREQEKREGRMRGVCLAPQEFLGSDMWEGHVQSQALSVGEREGTRNEG